MLPFYWNSYYFPCFPFAVNLHKFNIIMFLIGNICHILMLIQRSLQFIEIISYLKDARLIPVIQYKVTICRHKNLFWNILAPFSPAPSHTSSGNTPITKLSSWNTKSKLRIPLPLSPSMLEWKSFPRSQKSQTLVTIICRSILLRAKRF